MTSDNETEMMVVHFVVATVFTRIVENSQLKNLKAKFKILRQKYLRQKMKIYEYKGNLNLPFQFDH